MDDSQKAREVAYIINEKFESYARIIAEQLRREDFGGNSVWEELKLRLREKPDSLRAIDYLLNYSVERCSSKLLEGLAREELRLLWFGTKAADKAESPAFSRSTYLIELIRELYYRVRALAFKEDEGETTPTKSSLPVSRTSDEIVIPLADFLIGAKRLESLIFQNELDRLLLFHRFREGQDGQQVQEAVKDLLWNYPEFLLPEQREEALRLRSEGRVPVRLPEGKHRPTTVPVFWHGDVLCDLPATVSVSISTTLEISGKFRIRSIISFLV